MAAYNRTAVGKGKNLIPLNYYTDIICTNYVKTYDYKTHHQHSTQQIHRHCLLPASAGPTCLQCV